MRSRAVEEYHPGRP